MSVEQYTISDYMGALRRRLPVFSGVLGVVLLAAITVALALPDSYRSTAELRVDLEGPSVNLLEPVALTTYADQYIKSLQQKVLSYDNVKPWLEQLVADAEERSEREADLISEIIGNVRILMVTTSVANPEGGEVDLITGFTTSYSSRDPRAAQFVADKVAASFLAEDRALRMERAATTAEFLSEQIEAKSKEIVELEAKIAAFKEQHANSLPDMMTLNVTNLERTERDLEGVQTQISRLQENRIFLQAQLEELRRASPSTERAAELEEEYLRALAVYGPDHPNVQRLRRQVEALATTDVAGGNAELRQLEGELAALRQRYSDVHPDVLSLRRRIETLRAQGQRQPAGADLNRNPSYIQIRAQVNAADTELASLRARERELRQRYDETEDRIARMPIVERDYLALERALQTAQLAFDDLRTRLVQAQQTESFESGERGARLEQISAAAVPLSPTGPPRLAIAFLGAFLALSLAGGAALAAETMDKTVRSAKDIRLLLKLQPIAAIPVIQNSLARSEQRRKTAIVAMATMTLVVLVAIIVYSRFGI